MSDSRSQVRVHQIIIDSPKPDREPFITLAVQRRVFDEQGSLVQTINRERLIYKRLSEVATEIIEFDDPVLQKRVNDSVAGIGAALTSVSVKWLAEEYSSEPDENGIVWID